MKCYIGTYLILCAVFVIASALNCYDSTESKTVMCDGSCMNMTITKDGENPTLQKHCWPDKEEEKCITDVYMGVETKTCYCNEDGCNAGSTPSLFGLLLFIPLVIQWLSL